MGLKNTRLAKLWQFVDEHLEVDYGYLPKLPMDDKDDVRVDEYIQKIKDDFQEMLEKGWIQEESIQNCIDILKGLDKI